jgi:hypothetical protein
MFNVKLAQRVLVHLAPELKIAFHVCPLSRKRERVRERGFMRERAGEREKR